MEILFAWHALYFFYFKDDFYLNLVDWSSQNILSVGLGSCVYLWSAYTSQVYVPISPYSFHDFLNQV